VWFIADYLLDIPHTRLMTPGVERGLTRVDRRLFEAGLHGKRG
jgi:hypothetical protein